MAVRFNPPPGWPAPPEGFTPGPGWQPDPTWPAPPLGWQLWKSEETDGFAIAGFVLGLLGIGGIGAILGIVFGIIALRRIRRTFQRGRNLAIAGIVIGANWLAFIVLFIEFSR